MEVVCEAAVIGVVAEAAGIVVVAEAAGIGVVCEAGGMVVCANDAGTAMAMKSAVAKTNDFFMDFTLSSRGNKYAASPGQRGSSAPSFLRVAECLEQSDGTLRLAATRRSLMPIVAIPRPQ